VDQFYLEDLIEARLQTALAADAAGKAAAAAAAAANGEKEPWKSEFDLYSYEPERFAAYVNSSDGGALGAAAAAGRVAAKRGGEMPREAKVALGGDSKFPPTLRDYDRELKGYVVRVWCGGCDACMRLLRRRPMHSACKSVTMLQYRASVHLCC
jgi:hypothetical protein